MATLFIDYLKNSSDLFFPSVLGFLNERTKSFIEDDTISITSTIMGSSRIRFFKSVVVLAEDVDTGNFIVKNLQRLPEFGKINFTYLSLTSALLLFGGMKKEQDPFEYPKKHRDFSCILPNIYISDMSCANNRNLIETLDIRAIVNVSAKSCANPFEHDPSFSYFSIFEDDRPETDIAQYFASAYKFIEKHSKDSGVLIHCAAGISRSATIVISYVMKKLKLSFNEAFRFVQERHPNTDPNFGFIVQLQKYEEDALRD